MTKKQLAIELRERQILKGILPIDVIEVLSEIDDNTIIDCYIKCAGCGKYMIDINDLDNIIEKSNTVEDFLELTFKNCC